MFVRRAPSPSPDAVTIGAYLAVLVALTGRRYRARLADRPTVLRAVVASAIHDALNAAYVLVGQLLAEDPQRIAPIRAPHGRRVHDRR